MDTGANARSRREAATLVADQGKGRVRAARCRIQRGRRHARQRRVLAVDGVPGDAADWLFEIKFDGYRMLVRVDNGVPSFQALQNAFESARTGRIVFHLFEVSTLNGHDLRPEALETRRAASHGLFDARTPGSSSGARNARNPSSPATTTRKACAPTSAP